MNKYKLIIITIFVFILLVIAGMLIGNKAYASWYIGRIVNNDSVIIQENDIHSVTTENTLHRYQAFIIYKIYQRSAYFAIAETKPIYTPCIENEDVIFKLDDTYFNAKTKCNNNYDVTKTMERYYIFRDIRIILSMMTKKGYLTINNTFIIMQDNLYNILYKVQKHYITN